jgi:hypothetical protein
LFYTLNYGQSPKKKKFKKTIQGARGKIIEDACEKRENLLKTFQVFEKSGSLTTLFSDTIRKLQ